MFLSRGASQAAGRTPLGAFAPRELSERHWPSLPLAATAAPAAPPSRRGRQRRSEDRRRPPAGCTTRPLATAVAAAIAAQVQVAAWAAAAAAAPAALPACGAFCDEYADYYTEDDEVCPFGCGQLGSCYCHVEPLEDDITVGQFLEQCAAARAVRAASVAAVAAAVAVCSMAAGAGSTAAPLSPLSPAVCPPRASCGWGATTMAPADWALPATQTPAVCPLRTPCGWGATPVAPADWAKLQADPLQLWGPPEASWAAAVGALPAAQRTVANPLALTQPSGFPGGRGVEEVLTSPPSPPESVFPAFSLPDLVEEVVQAEAEVRFFIQQHRAAWLELESSKLQCRLEAMPRGPPKPRRAPVAPLQPLVLPLLQGTASLLLAGPAACLKDVALNGGALPNEDAGLQQRPSGLPPHPTPNLTSRQGRAESWERAGLGNPPPSPPLRKTAGAGFNGSLPAAGCPNGGASRWLPPPVAAMGEDHNFPLPDKQARAVAHWREPGAATGLPQGCHRAATGLPQGANRSRRGRARARAPDDRGGGPRGFLGGRGKGGSCYGPPLTGAPPGAMGTPPHKWPGIQRVRTGQGSGQGSDGVWRGPVGLPREQWRRGSGSDPPLTGASSGALGNPSHKGRAPPRRLHGRASSEVT